MKRFGQLFERIVDWGNLQRAAAKARRRKRFRRNVAAFEFEQERELLALQSELQSGIYCPGDYRTFIIYEPKRRQISAAPYRDRVVHHALCNIIEPIFEQAFIHDSYACRSSKGTHAAANRAQTFAKCFPYVLKADVTRFFPSVDHDVLLARLATKLKDARVLQLLEKIVRHPFPGQEIPLWFPGDDLLAPLERSCGLPIGNQTSQFFGNVMLDPLDHFVKENLRCRGYVRYADDFLLFGHSKSQLHAWREEVGQFLLEVRLRLHPRKSVVFPVREGIPFLGFRLFPTHRRLCQYNLRRFQRRLRRLQREFAEGRVTLEEVRQRVVSWWGHAQHADAWRIASQILNQHEFTKHQPPE